MAADWIECESCEVFALPKAIEEVEGFWLSTHNDNLEGRLGSCRLRIDSGTPRRNNHHDQFQHSQAQ